MCKTAWLPLLVVLASAVSASRAPSLLLRKREKYLPVVLWHGMGDSCCHPQSMGALARRLESELGTFVHSIATGHGETSDVLSGFFGDVNAQVDAACAELAALPELADGFVAVGFSQGGQFLRAVAQRCQHTLPGPMHTLVTMGSQHQGVMEVPGCWGPSFNATPTALCRAVEALLSHGAYYDWVQRSVVQAAYWKDPYNLDQYRTHSSFLAGRQCVPAPCTPEALSAQRLAPVPPRPADINAESAAEPAKPHYCTNLASLRSLVLYLFDNDVTVVPKESSHFGWCAGRAT